MVKMSFFSPDLFERIREIEDCRKKSEYELAELIVAGIFMMIKKSGSRNSFNNYEGRGQFKKVIISGVRLGSCMSYEYFFSKGLFFY
jgi:hypothetical protein